MMVVDISYGPSLKPTKPIMLWRGNYLAGAGSSCGMAGPTSANYDVTPDGERFLMIEDASSTAESERLRVISNWSVELKNPGAINLQSSTAHPMPSAYGLLCRVPPPFKLVDHQVTVGITMKPGAEVTRMSQIFRVPPALQKMQTRRLRRPRHIPTKSTEMLGT